MRRSLLPFLLFLSCCTGGMSCSRYRHMKKIHTDESCLSKLKPDFTHVVYKTSVDVIGKHISGLLLIKLMPDSSTRIVFSNAFGFKYFDFGFLAKDSFTVYQIIPQMNKQPLIKTLRKDFELVMLRTMEKSSGYALADSGLIYHAYPQVKGVNYYVTDSACGRLIKMQRASKKKPVMEAVLFGGSAGDSPDSISIRHLNFDFTITLKKTS